MGMGIAVRNARTVCAVEIEAYCQKKLVEKIEKGLITPFPLWSNIKTFDGKPWRGRVDCVIGGYPCQPFSVAGKQKGKEDPRHLWPDVARIVRECKPSVCFFENVGGHLRLGFEQVYNDLSAMGYRVETALFTASEIGAPHKRERQFIMAYSEGLLDTHASTVRGQKQQPEMPTGSGGSNTARTMADDNQQRTTIPLERQQSGKQVPTGTSDAWRPFPPKPDGEWGNVPDHLKPAVHRMADGLAEKVDEIRMHGNGVVPLQAAYAFTTLWNSINGK